MTNAQKIEVITSVERRRRWSVEEKIRMVEEARRPGMSVSYVARIHGVAPSQLFKWRTRMAERSREAVRADDEVVSAAEVRELKRQVRELQRVLGKKTMGNEILRDAVRIAHEKTNLALAVASERRYPMKAIAQALQVSRSNLIEQHQKRRTKRSTCCKPADEGLLPIIRQFVDDQPAYGYRRITALLDMHWRLRGESRLNHKRVFRIMQQHNPLLQQCTGGASIERTPAK